MITQKFYPITVTELTSLSGKLTEAEIVIYLYLMAANPFGDRFQELDTSVIAENLGVTRRTVQRTLKKLESLGLIELEIKSFRYRKNTEELDDPRIAKRQEDRQGDPRIALATVGSPERQQDRQGELEPLQDKDSETSKTTKTIKTSQTAKDEAGDIFSEEKLTPSKISQEIIDRLTELDIPINKKIEEAIEKYGECQAKRAIDHIKETAGTIKSKYAVFLYQISQKQEDSRKQLSKEFLEWYQYAKGEITEDIPPELLPQDRHGEPLIRMRSRPGELIAWQRAKSGESFTRCTREELRASLEKIAPDFANKLRKGGKNE